MAGYVGGSDEGVAWISSPDSAGFNSNYEFEAPLEQLHFTEGLV
jgi:hypothetical protein